MSTWPAMVKFPSSMNGIISAVYSEGMICLGNLKVIYKCIFLLLLHMSSTHGPDIRDEALFFGEYIEGGAVKELRVFVDADAPLADILRRHRSLLPPAFKAAVGE